jgi:hypothetical protein
MMLSRRSLLAAAAASTLGSTVGATVERWARADDDDGAANLLARIGKARAALSTLRGPFTQARTIGLLAAEVRSHGTLTLVRPDRLRWELEPPDAITFWIGPEGLAYRSAHGHGNMTEPNAKIAASLDDLRTLLGGDVARLRDRWRLRVAHDGPDGAEIEATPMAPQPGGLTALRFALTPDLVRPTRVLLAQGARDRTTIEFGDLVVNGPVDAATMHPPPG